MAWSEDGSCGWPTVWHESIMSHFFHLVNQCKNFFRKRLSFRFYAGRVDGMLKHLMKKSLHRFFHASTQEAQ
jgi:hypothetical protein